MVEGRDGKAEMGGAPEIPVTLSLPLALAVAGDDPQALNAMGLVRFEQQDSVAALALHRRALALKPDIADAHNNIGNLLKEAGDPVAAGKAYERAVEIDPREVAYYLNLADSRKFVEGDAYLKAMQGLARDPEALSHTARSRLNFALSKAYDDLGRYDDAFGCMCEGNALKRARIDYEEAGMLELFERIRATFDRRLLEASADAGHRSSLPVFVVGMPRSGTTLVEQILASHPSVHGAGELLDWSLLVSGMRGADGDPVRYLEEASALAAEPLHELGRLYVEGLARRAPGTERITDKMPGNFLLVGLIHLALPRAHIIHVKRDPRDTCLSCYSKLFTAEQNFSCDLGELGRYYRKYAELMAHWRDVLPRGRMLEVRYEDVVDDLEASARRIVDHCGLDWSPQCIAFHEARRPVRTASASQVRRRSIAARRGAGAPIRITWARCWRNSIRWVRTR